MTIKRDSLMGDIASVHTHLHEGRFQRGLSLMAGGASFITGLEVAYEHYHGSYSQRVMYTPVALSVALGGAGIWGFASATAARTVLRFVSVITLADSVLGMYFHIRGIARKPGGWSLPITNMVMGPPISAPLLFGTAAYMALIASYLRREDAESSGIALHIATECTDATCAAKIREGKFQQHMLVATAISAMLSGVDALISHFKSGFRSRPQWLPVAIAPTLAIASIAAIRKPALAQSAVPTLSVAACVVAAVGVYYHGRGIFRRPGGIKQLLYNILYGPPIFAPMLFGAAGMFGLLASQLRRSES